MTGRPQVALLPDGRRLHLQDGPIDLVVEAFGSAEAVRAAYGMAVRRFDGLLDELCAELVLLRAPARADGTALAGPVARRMYAAVAPHAGSSFSRLCREKVPEGRMRARAAKPGGCSGRGGPSSRPASRVAARRSPHPPPSGAPSPTSRWEKEGAAFITPMAAVAGAVADEILAAMTAAAPLTRAYVNNGGDIALFLAPGERFAIGLVDRPDRPSLDPAALFARTVLSAGDGIGGIATSGWRGRSFSLGIADAVTVLAADAAAADAAATVVANAVDLPGHPAIVRVPACDLQPDSDLADRLVTRGVGALTSCEIDTALARGVAVAEALCRGGLIAGAALHLAGRTRIAGAAAALRAATPSEPAWEGVHG